MPSPSQVDPRGLRVAAGLTSVVLAVALVAPRPLTLVLLAVQAVVFAVGALVSLRLSPYALLYATLVRPRLGPPAQTEDARPPRFAQAVGLAFTLVALAGFGLGVAALGYAATALALVAALLNATIGLCLGCEMYLAVRRLRPTGAATPA